MEVAMIAAFLFGLLVALIPGSSPVWRVSWGVLAFLSVFIVLSNIVPMKSPAVCFEHSSGWKVLVAVPKPFC